MGKCLDTLKSVKRLVFNRNQSVKLTLQDTSCALEQTIYPEECEVGMDAGPQEETLVLDYQYHSSGSSQVTDASSTSDLNSLDELLSLMGEPKSYAWRREVFNCRQEPNSDSGVHSEELPIYPLPSTPIASSYTNTRVKNKSDAFSRPQRAKPMTRHSRSTPLEEAELGAEFTDWSPFGLEWKWHITPNGRLLRNGDILLTIEEVEEGERVKLGKEVSPRLFEELSEGEISDNTEEMEAALFGLVNTTNKRKNQANAPRINLSESSSISINTEYLEQCLASADENSHKTTESQQTSASFSLTDEEPVLAADTDRFSTNSSLGIYDSMPSDSELESILVV